MRAISEAKKRRNSVPSVGLECVYSLIRFRSRALRIHGQRACTLMISHVTASHDHDGGVENRSQYCMSPQA